MIDDHIAAAVTARPLLAHPFYRRWQRGDLSPDALRAYAGQYRHIEASVPRWLRAIGERVETPVVSRLVERTLADEVGPISHLDLFDRFAAAMDAPRHAIPTPATERLLACHDRLAEGPPPPALAALAYYECQAAAVSGSKAEGLRLHYGLHGEALDFWNVHAGLEDRHAAWTLSALQRLTGDHEAAAAQGAWEAADAWWGFLDEREAAAQ